MSENIVEPLHQQKDSASQEEASSQESRMRSISEIYSMGYTSTGSEAHERSENDGSMITSGFTSPMIANGDEKSKTSDIPFIDGIVMLGPAVSDNTEKSSRQSDHRGRLFSELSISDMPTENDDGNVKGVTCSLGAIPPLDISFPCSYEENMESRGQSILQLRQAAIKRVLIRSG